MNAPSFMEAHSEGAESEGEHWYGKGHSVEWITVVVSVLRSIRRVY